jgi:Zn ribbon nucleic-acid-binding protein
MLASVMAFVRDLLAGKRCPACGRRGGMKVIFQDKRYEEIQHSPMWTEEKRTDITDYQCRYCGHTVREDRSRSYQEGGL